MDIPALVMKLYASLATAVLAAHLAWIAWVIFGCLLTRRSAWLRWFHIASLIYGIAIELGPWDCPLTLVEQALLGRAGVTPYNEGFLFHYLQAVIYPDVSPLVLAWCGTAVCGVNLGVYGWRLWRAKWRDS